MKNDIIIKVNKIGNAGCIITNIAKVILSIGFVVCVMAGIVLAMMPKGFVTIDVSGDAAIAVDLNKVPIIDTQDFTQIDDFEKLGVEISSDIEINGVDYGVVSAQQQDGVYTIDAHADAYTIDIGNLGLVVVIAAVYIIAAIVVLHFVNKLCKEFKTCTTPFTENIVSALKKLAISIIPMAFLASLTDSVTGSIMSGNVEITVGVDLMTILLVLLIFMLAAIFSYGAMLQTESDETL